MNTYLYFYSDSAIGFLPDFFYLTFVSPFSHAKDMRMIELVSHKIIL